MKRLITVLIVALAIMSLGVSAFATNAPSPVPSIVLEKYVSVSGNEFPNGFVIEVIKPGDFTDAVLAVYTDIESVVEQGQSISAIFTQEELEKMAIVLPDGTNLEKLDITEYIPLTITGECEGIDEVEATFIIPGEYLDEDVLVSMLGILNDAETVTWLPVSTKVVDGKIVVNFTEDTLVSTGNWETVLMVLRAE